MAVCGSAGCAGWDVEETGQPPDGSAAQQNMNDRREQIVFGKKTVIQICARAYKLYTRSLVRPRPSNPHDRHDAAVG